MNTKTKTIIAVSVIFILTGITVGYYFQQKNNAVVLAPQEVISNQNIEQTSAESQTREPEKTDFDTSVPTDFPTDIPLENGAKVEQSYGLNYVGQKQLTMVFLSTKTVKENYSLYADFLKKQNRNVLNTYDSLAVSSLYSTKETNDINITISENTSSASIKSQVSISVLKK